MEFKSEIHGDIGIIVLKGKLMGLPYTDVLNNEVKALMNKKINKIIFDCHDVEWINSSGIGAIMRSYISIKKSAGEFALVRISEKVASVLEITRLIKIFQINNSVDEAVKSF